MALTGNEVLFVTGVSQGGAPSPVPELTTTGAIAALGGGGGGATLPSATTSQLYGGTGNANTAQAVTPGTGLSLAGGTLNGLAVGTTSGTARDAALAIAAEQAASTQVKIAGALVKNTYTAAGALPITDDVSIVNASATAAMTLANDTVDGHMRTIKRFGAGTVTVTATIDGTSQTVTMNTNSTIRESLTLLWVAALSSYVAV